MSPRIVDKDKKRELILRGALNVCASKGLRGFKIIDVARAAGIGKGTIYEYFASKEEMITGCFDLFMRDFGSNLSKNIEGFANPKDKISAVFHFSFTYFAEHRDFLGVLFDFWAASLPKQDSQPLVMGIEKEYIEFREYLSGILNDGIGEGAFRQHDTDTIALLILAVLDGLLFQSVLGVINIEDKSLPDKLSKLILEGILV